MECKLCGCHCETKRGLSNHLTAKHKDEMTKEQYSNLFNMGWVKYCKTCGVKISSASKTGYCNKHRDRTGANNAFYGKTHTQKTRQKLKVNCRLATAKLWQNQEYRKKVIDGTSKPRSEVGKLNISNGVKNSYDTIDGLRQLRSIVLKNTWQSGNMVLSEFHINKSKPQYQIAQWLTDHFPNRNISLKQSIKYKLGNKCKWFYPDILIDHKIIIQYFGDYWHMNPNIYQSDFVNERTKVCAAQCWEHDSQRIETLRNMGYTVIIIWQSEFKHNKDGVKSELLHALAC